MEGHAVIGRIVKAGEIPPAIGAVIRETRIFRNFLAQRNQFRPDFVDRFAVLQPAPHLQFPHALAFGAVRVFIERRQLQQGFFLAINRHRLGAGNFCIGHTELSIVVLQGDILFAEDVGGGFHLPQGDAHAIGTQATRQQFLLQAIFCHAHWRQHIIQQMRQIIFGGGIGGVLCRFHTRPAVPFVD